MKAIKLPSNLVSENAVAKLSLISDENQHLFIFPNSSILLHGHDNPSQWEVWLRNDTKEAYVCLKGEKHKLTNLTNSTKHIESVKGHLDYSYYEICQYYMQLGYTVYHKLNLIFN